ncbi:hypothetical protein DFQ27_009611 [Actinomortierella ambigua]|uniref:UBA domain-containing protein n=1 Tax=Actinomortierella ambigua TaxID=1343610 RepID=A0A9P6QJG1_9FUNG|nr:hypothetical protein DFQ27_009611 [Actinomortierella ambigua]
MDSRPSEFALTKIPLTLDVEFSFPPYPNAEQPQTIRVKLVKDALLGDALRQARTTHNVPVYFEQSMLATAESLIREAELAALDDETKRADEAVFAGQEERDTKEMSERKKMKQRATTSEGDDQGQGANDQEHEPNELEILQQQLIDNYRTHTAHYYTSPEENLFPEAYHTLIHSPVPSLFDAILDVERSFAHEVETLTTARDQELQGIEDRHHQALQSDTPHRNLTQLMTEHVEAMEVAQATWNSRLDDVQAMQRQKYRELILELYDVFKKQQQQQQQPSQQQQQRQLNEESISRSAVSMSAEALMTQEPNRPLTGVEMVSQAMRTIEERKAGDVGKRQLVDGNGSGGEVASSSTGGLGTGDPSSAEPSQGALPSISTPQPSSSDQQVATTDTAVTPSVPEPQPSKEDLELKQMAASLQEMGFTQEQAEGALIIYNRNMDDALNLLLEKPDKIPGLLLAKQKAVALAESTRQKKQAQAPQPPSQRLVARSTSVSTPSSSPRQQQQQNRQSWGNNNNLNTNQAARDKVWSPIPFLQQGRNALLTSNASPSVKKIGGWLNKAIENLGLDDEVHHQSSRQSGNGGLASSPNLMESFTVVLGTSHSKVTHNLRLAVTDASEIFPAGGRLRSDRDAAIHAQTSSSLYGRNLTGLVQLVNIKDWAKYKRGQTVHQEFFKACYASTELHFDPVERQLEQMEEDLPLDGSTLCEGDFVLTRHSNLPMIHVVFHLFYGDNFAPGTQTPALQEFQHFIPKQDLLMGIRSILKMAHRYDITMLSLPFLMLPALFEYPSVGPPATVRYRSPSNQQHHRTLSTPGSPSVHSPLPSSPVASPSRPSSVAGHQSLQQQSQQHLQQQQQQQQQQSQLTEQSYRREFHRRAEVLMRHIKSCLMDNARELKQVGNQGAEAEMFRVSQGGDVKVLQFLLPKSTSEEMFNSYRNLLSNVFGVS